MPNSASRRARSPVGARRRRRAGPRSLAVRRRQRGWHHRHQKVRMDGCQPGNGARSRQDGCETMDLRLHPRSKPPPVRVRGRRAAHGKSCRATARKPPALCALTAVVLPPRRLRSAGCLRALAARWWPRVALPGPRSRRCDRFCRSFAFRPGGRQWARNPCPRSVPLSARPGSDSCIAPAYSVVGGGGRGDLMTVRQRPLAWRHSRRSYRSPIARTLSTRLCSRQTVRSLVTQPGSRAAVFHACLQVRKLAGPRRWRPWCARSLFRASDRRNAMLPHSSSPVTYEHRR